MAETLSNGVNVKLELRSHQNLILSSIEWTIRKIEILILIPELCSCLVNGARDIESQIGAVSSNTLYDLLLCQLAWIDSKKRTGCVNNTPDTHASVRHFRNHDSEDIFHLSRTAKEFLQFGYPIRIRENGKSMSHPLHTEDFKNTNNGIKILFSNNENTTKLSVSVSLDEGDSQPVLTTNSFIERQTPINGSSLPNPFNHLEGPHLPNSFELGKSLDRGRSPKFVEKLFKTSSEKTQSSSHESCDFDLSSASDRAHLKDEIMILLKGDSFRSMSNGLSSSRSKSSEFEYDSFIYDNPKRTSLQTILEHVEESNNTVELSSSSMKVELMDDSKGLGHLSNNVIESYDKHYFVNEMAASVAGSEKCHPSLEEVIYNFNKSPDTTVEENYLIRIKHLYETVMKELLKTECKQPWIQIFLQNLNISEKFHPGVSSGLWNFRKYMIHLKELVKQRFHSPDGDSQVYLDQLKKCWIRKLIHEEKMQVLEMCEKEQISKWTQRVNDLDTSIKSLVEEIEINRKEMFEDVKSTVRNELVLNFEQTTTQNLEMEKHKLLTSTLMTQNEKYHYHFLERERYFNSNIQVLEKSFENLLKSYDTTMTDRQIELDLLNEKIMKNEAEIGKLKQAFVDTEERFEDMRITMKLKELLRNIEMADNFKRNRAARVIQSAWRKYRIKKFRKLRRKARMRRKPGIPGQNRTTDTSRVKVNKLTNSTTKTTGNRTKQTPNIKTSL